MKLKVLLVLIGSVQIAEWSTGKWQGKWTVSKAHLWSGKALEKRVSRVITIRLRLISTPVTLWFMAPVSPASKLQMSNTRKRDREGNRERQRKKGGKDFCFLSLQLYFSLQSLERIRTMIFLPRPLNKPPLTPTVCFVTLFRFLEKHQVLGTHLFLFCWM